jgi:predicted enzyme related to lactoylglutathione lyase
VTQGPQEVPGKDWVLAATDPAGATFGLVSANNE